MNEFRVPFNPKCAWVAVFLSTPPTFVCIYLLLEDVVIKPAALTLLLCIPFALTVFLVAGHMCCTAEPSPFDLEKQRLQEYPPRMK